MRESKRFSEVDVLYTIGAFLVVLGHSHYSNWTLIENTPLALMTNSIYIFHMPLFFFIAGFLFINSNRLLKTGYKNWIIDKIKRFLVPYLIISIVTVIPKYYFENRTFSGIIFHTFKALLAPRCSVWNHFWFLPVLLMIYAIFGLWKFLSVKINETILIYGTLAVSLGLYFLPIKTEWFGITDLRTYIFYFTFGMFFYLFKTRQRKVFNRIMYLTISVVITCIFVVVCIMYYDSSELNSIYLLLMSLGMIIACWCLACFIKESRISSWVSKHNFTIYIYSWIFQSVVMAICEMFSINCYIATILMFVTGFGIPSLMAIIYEKMPKLHNKFFDLLLGVK